MRISYGVPDFYVVYHEHELRQAAKNVTIGITATLLRKLAEERQLKTNDLDLCLEGSQVILAPDHRLLQSFFFLNKTLSFILGHHPVYCVRSILLKTERWKR